MQPSFLARGFRRFCTAPHFKGKDRLERLVEPLVRLPARQNQTTFPDGMIMELDPDSSFERSFYFRNAEVDTFEFIRDALAPGDVFFDCGSNIGFYALVASRRVGPSGRVFAFEPTPSTFLKLKRNLELNRSSNIRAFQLALGDRSGVGRVLQFSADNHGMNTIAEGATAGENVGACEIRTLDELIAGKELLPPSLIKIDVEGSELALLRGAEALLRSDRSPTLIVELSRFTMRRAGYEPEAVVEYLLSLRNYRVEWPFLGRTRIVGRGAVLPHYAKLGSDHGANYVFRPAPRS